MTSSDRNHAHLHEIMSALGRPAYVKEAAAIDFGELDRIPSSSFADLGARQFPCHTKEACWVSAAYMAHDGVSGEPIKRLEKFAATWGIENDVQMTFAKAEVRRQLAKVAAAAIPYALDETYNGAAVRRFPVATPEMVKLSADRFYADRAKYPYEWRVKTASALRAKIAEHQVEAWIADNVRDYLDRAVGAGTLNKAAVWRELATVEHHLPRFDGIEKLAEIVELLVSSADPAIVKIACATFAKVHEAGLREYVAYLPEERLVGETVTKVAADRANYIKLADGSTVDARELNLEKLAEVLPSFAGEMTTAQVRERLAALTPAQAEVARFAACG